MAEVKSKQNVPDADDKSAERPHDPILTDGYVSQGGPVSPEEIPGAVITVAQLPNPDVLRAAGIDPVRLSAQLNVVHDDAEAYAVRNGDKPVSAVDFGDEVPVGKTKR